MRAISLITLSLSSIGLLTFHALGKGDQTTAASSSPPSPEAQPDVDQETTNPDTAISPPRPASPETSSDYGAISSAEAAPALSQTKPPFKLPEASLTPLPLPTVQVPSLGAEWLDRLVSLSRSNQSKASTEPARFPGPSQTTPAEPTPVEPTPAQQSQPATSAFQPAPPLVPTVQPESFPPSRTGPSLQAASEPVTISATIPAVTPAVISDAPIDAPVDAPTHASTEVESDRTHFSPETPASEDVLTSENNQSQPPTEADAAPDTEAVVEPESNTSLVAQVSSEITEPNIEPNTESISELNTEQIPESTSTKSMASPVPVAVASAIGAEQVAQAVSTPPVPVAPVNASGVDLSYVLGPGDVIQISVFNVPEYSGEQRILVDGTVNLPLVGRTAIAGLTLQQAEAAISARYASELEYPVVTVGLSQTRSLQVALAGEIGQPGLYSLSSNEGGQFPTIVQAVQTAGGATQAADLRQVQVRRRDQTGATRTITVDLLALLQSGDINQNAALRDGDVIFIPTTAEINLADANQLAVSNLRTTTNQPVNAAIVGEVTKPGPYRLGSEGGQATLIQLIQQAGGITPSANLQQVQLYRQTRQGTEQVITLDLWKVLQSGDLSQDIVLQSGDRVTIPTAEALTSEQIASLSASSLATEAIQVNIVGEVESPGQLTLRPNTTLNQAILAAGGFNGRANRKNIKLIRFNVNGTVTEQAFELDLSQGLDAQTNPILRNSDVIIVGRSTGARVTDTLSDILGVIQLIRPLVSPVLPF